MGVWAVDAFLEAHEGGNIVVLDDGLDICTCIVSGARLHARRRSLAGRVTIGQALLEGRFEAAGGLALGLQYRLELANNEVAGDVSNERGSVFTRERVVWWSSRHCSLDGEGCV